MSSATDPTVRHDIVWLFEATDSNPNGDPDAGNRPRVDPETSHGLMSDVSLKRKIRDTLPLAAADEEGYEIFVQAGGTLNEKLEKSYEATGTKLDDAKKRTPSADDARAWLTKKYADIRLFGGVLSTGKTSGLGQIRGPVQVSFARTFDPVTPSEHAITRQAHTAAGKDGEEKQGGTMGTKWTIPYGLFKATISYSASRGIQTGVSDKDLELLYRCVLNAFDHTASASRPSMSTRGLYVFSHDDAFGRAPMQALVDRVKVAKADGITVPRSFTDYSVTVDTAGLPEGITLDSMV